jgi:hypothetical protein
MFALGDGCVGSLSCAVERGSVGSEPGVCD